MPIQQRNNIQWFGIGDWVNQVSVQFAPVSWPLSLNFRVIRLGPPFRIPGFSSLGKPYGGSVSPPVFGPEYPLRSTMLGSGDIKPRESSIITWQISSDMGFVRKTNRQKNINIRSNSKKRAIPMIPEWLAFWKEFIPSLLSHPCIIKTAPSPAPTHPQTQTNKQNLSCCLLYCNFYSDLEKKFEIRSI